MPVQEAHKLPQRFPHKDLLLRHTITKLSKVKHRERILKTVGKNSSYTRGPLVQFLSCIQLFVTLSTVHQAPLSMGFSRQVYWSGLPFPSSGDLPCPRTEPGSPALQILYQLSHQLEALSTCTEYPFSIFHSEPLCILKAELSLGWQHIVGSCYFYPFSHSPSFDWTI